MVEGDCPKKRRNDDWSTVAYVLALALLAFICHALYRQRVVPLTALLFEPVVASLYLWTCWLLLACYAPAAARLVARVPGGKPVLLTCSVAALALATAPLQGIFRLRADPWLPELRVAVATGALLGWLWALTSGHVDEEDESGKVARLASVVLATTAAGAAWSRVGEGVELALQTLLFVGLHVSLVPRAAAKPRASPASPWTWRLLGVAVVAPLVAAASAPLVLTGGHVLCELKDAVVNHAGLPLCGTRHAAVYPTSLFELQAVVRTHRHVRPVGGRHSWSALMCPADDGEGTALVRTDALRGMVYEPATQQLRVGGGALFGSVQHKLIKENRMLKSSWHKDVSVGGAIATGVQHLGVGIASLVAEVSLVTANGSLWTLRRGDPEFDFVFGSVGMLGVTYEAVLDTEPRTAFEWASHNDTWTDEASLAAIVEAWVRNETRQSVLWLNPFKKRSTLQVMTRGAPLAPPSAETVQAAHTPHLPVVAHGDVGLTFALYQSWLSLALALAEPLVRALSRAIAAQAMQSFIDDYVTDEVSRPHEPLAARHDHAMSALPTQFATTEIGLSVTASDLPRCVLTLARSPCPAALHLRWAQPETPPLINAGPDVVHGDLSISEPLLPRLADFLDDVVRDCPLPRRADGFVAAQSHAGKLTLRDVAKREPWAAPRAALHPGSEGSLPHAAFRRLVAEWDPHGKFRPAT